MSDLDLLVLSPHLDDAALSCGGEVARRCRLGERVLVCTLFTADEPAKPISPLVRTLHRLYGLEGGVLASRRREDLSSCAVLGASARHAGLTEAIYRTAEDGKPLYPDLRALFGSVRVEDGPLLERLGETLAALPAARQVLAPLAVGRHVDHQLVRRAAAEVFGPELLYYEDFPYVRRWGALSRALGARRGWEPRSIPLEEVDLATKVRAIAAFGSQILPLFKSRTALERRVRRHARRVGGERRWRRAGPSPNRSTTREDRSP